MKMIKLQYALDEMMLILEFPSGTYYQNYVGADRSSCVAMMGILIPLGPESALVEHIRNTLPGLNIEGITSEVADVVDSLFAEPPMSRVLRVDRTRMAQSRNAWLHVEIDSPETAEMLPYQDYLGVIYGFGKTRGVLTWP
jgi:hypothetical protein